MLTDRSQNAVDLVPDPGRHVGVGGQLLCGGREAGDGTAVDHGRDRGCLGRSSRWSVVGAEGVVGADKVAGSIELIESSWDLRVLGCACDGGHRDQEEHHKILL